MYSSPVRHSPPIRASSYCAAVRLACVRPAASVHSEPGSNSSLKITCPKANYFSCRSSTTGNLSLAKQLICCILIKRLQDGQSSFLQASAQITCAHCQRTLGMWPQRRSRQLRRFRRSEPPIIADFFLPSTPHFEVVDAASFRPEGFLRSEPAILAGFSSSSTPREEEVAAAALQSAVASFRVASRPS